MEIPVIIVTYNSAGHILPCLRAVLMRGQTHTPLVTVVDNHSTDDTLALVRKEFPQVHVLANKTNAGYAKALNLALKNLSAQWCLLLNPDTEWQTDILSKLLQTLRQNERAWCCGPAVTDATGKFIRAYGCFPSLGRILFEQFFLHRLFPAFYQYQFLYSPDYAKTRMLRQVDYISGAAMLVDVNKVKAAGYFDEDFFLYGEETELAWRMEQKGFSALLCTEAVITHHEGASIGQLDMTEQTLLHRKGLLLYFQKTAGPFELLLVRLALSLGDLLRILWRNKTFRLLSMNWSSRL